MIQFVKILSYDLRPRHSDRFEYLSKVAYQTVDPPSLEPGRLDLAVQVVLHSPLRRAAECLRITAGVVYLERDELREITFNLKSLCTRKEWRKYGSTIIRKRFKEAFVEDRLLIPREQIFSEVREILRQGLAFSRHGSVAVVSHSFKLKMFESFLGSDGKIESEPELIHGYIFDAQKTYEFGGGFTVT